MAFSFGAPAGQTQAQPAASGSLFGNTANASTSNTSGTGTGFSGFGTASNTTAQQPASGGLFGSTSNNTTNATTGGTGLFGQQQQAKPAGGLFGSTSTPAANTGGGLFGSTSQPPQQSGTTGGGLFGSTSTPAANTNTGGGLFGSTTQPAQQTGGAGLFGSQPASSTTTTGGLFGQANNNAAQPASGGLFGSTAAKPATGGLFGSTTQQPAASGGLFGSTTQQQPQQGGLFGSTANTQQNQQQSSLFGAPKPAGGLFGSTTQQPNALGASTQQPGLFGSTNQQPQQPAVAPEPTIEERMMAIKNAWDPASPDCKFKYFFYNVVEPGTTGAYGRPAGATDDAKWARAVRDNPDPSCMVPVLATSFSDVKKRVQAQEQLASVHQQRVKELNAALQKLSQQTALSSSVRLQALQQHLAQLQQRLLHLAAQAPNFAPAQSSAFRPEEGEMKQTLEEVKDTLDGRQRLVTKNSVGLTAAPRAPSKGRMIGQVNELWGQIEEVRRLRRRGDQDWTGDEKLLAEIAVVLEQQQTALSKLSQLSSKGVFDADVMQKGIVALEGR